MIRNEKNPNSADLVIQLKAQLVNIHILYFCGHLKYTTIHTRVGAIKFGKHFRSEKNILSQKYCVQIKTKISEDWQLFKTSLLILMNKFLRISDKISTLRICFFLLLRLKVNRVWIFQGFFFLSLCLWLTVFSCRFVWFLLHLAGFLDFFQGGSFVSRWHNRYSCCRFPLWSLFCYFANSEGKDGLQPGMINSAFATEEGDEGYWRQRNHPGNWAEWLLYL